MTRRCAECGAPLDDGRACRDYFEEMLTLEARVPDAPGALPHFLAVASYNLQHPSSFTVEAIEGLRMSVADVLAGHATLADVRRRAARGAGGTKRVRRRADEGPSTGLWRREWPMTVRDVCRVGPDQYAERVREWAVSIIATTDGLPHRF